LDKIVLRKLCQNELTEVTRVEHFLDDIWNIGEQLFVLAVKVKGLEPDYIKAICELSYENGILVWYLIDKVPVRVVRTVCTIITIRIIGRDQAVDVSLRSLQ